MHSTFPWGARSQKNLAAAFLAICLAHFMAPSHSRAQEAVVGSSENWPNWRGPLASGVAPSAKPPWEWSETKNVRWKVTLPGRGHSTPVIWNQRLFVTAAIPVGPALEPRYSQAEGTHDGVPVTHEHQFVAMAIDRNTGEILWQETLRTAVPHEGGHATGSLASNSAVTDGDQLFVSFGSYGLYCLDPVSGQKRWERDFGLMNTKHGHGEGSSPVLADDTLVVNWDHEGESFVVAMDAKTGATRWQVRRTELTNWSTPIVVRHHKQHLLIISGTTRIRAYDLSNGQVVWECGGLSSNIVASPVAADGYVYLGSSYESRALLAIQLEGARGDITGTDRVVWTRSRGTPYVPSLLLYDQSLYFLTHYQGILTRVHGPTGEDQPGALRLGPLRDIYASPVAADQRVYVTDLLGTTVVISHHDIPRILAVNRLDETFSASAALAGNQLFLRGHQSLYCLQEMSTTP